jgi:hypothetical protein
MTTRFSIAQSAALLALASAPLLVAAPAHAQVDWTVYRPTNTGILGDFVQTIALDEQDRPWIAAYTPFWEEGGMSHMNADGTWTVLSSFDQPAIGSPRFHDILRAPGGSMWIGTDDGLLRYDPAVGPSSLVRFDSTNTSMPTGRVYDVDLAPDGTLWLAIYDVTGPGGGLAQFNPGTNTWRTWTTSNGLPWGSQWPGWDDLGHVAVLPDASGPGYTVWFSAAANLGVGTYRDGAFQWLGNPQSPPPGQYPLSLPSADPVDDQGNLWILTNQGLARRSPDGTYTVTGYPAGLSTEVSVVFALRAGRAVLGTYYSDVFIWDSGWTHIGNWGSGSHTYAFAEDSTGAIWTGGIGGSAKYENGAWQRYRLTNTGMISFWINAIDFDPRGNVYMNGNAGPGVGGFNIFDGSRWVGVNDANYGLGPAWGLPSDDVAAMCVRANGRLALAPAGIQGLLEWDGSSYTYLIPQGFDILEVDEDTLGRLWAVHYGNEGITRLTGATRQHFGSNDSPLPAGSIGSVEVDRTRPGFVWITTAFGIAHTDGDTWEIFPRELLGLTQNTSAELLSCAAPAPDGTLWIGSFSGVYRFNPSTHQFTRFTRQNGALPSNDVHHLHIAPDGTPWVATFDSVFPYPGGLSHFDGSAWATYTRDNSPLPHNQIGVLNSRPGTGGYELWVGTASEGAAALTVTSGTPCRPDLTGDGQVNLQDFLAFLQAYSAGSAPADFDANGSVNVQDFLGFLQAYAAGC